MKLQTPEIGEALRRQLGLTTPVGMSLDPTVVPVALVADVTPRVVEEARNYSARCFRSAGGAGTYNRFMVQWSQVAPVKRVEVTSFFFTTTTAQYVGIGWASPQPAGATGVVYTMDQVPTAVQNIGATRLFDDNSIVAPITNEYALRVYCPANVTVAVELARPFVLTQPGTGASPGLNIQPFAANSDFEVGVLWRELLA